MSKTFKILLFTISAIITSYFLINAKNIAYEVKLGDEQATSLLIFFIGLFVAIGTIVTIFIFFSDFLFLMLKFSFKKNIPTLIKLEATIIKFGKRIHIHKLRSARAVGAIYLFYVIIAITIAHFYIEHPGVFIPAVLGIVFIGMLIFYGIPIFLTLLYVFYKILFFIARDEKHKIKPLLREELRIIYILRDKD